MLFAPCHVSKRQATAGSDLELSAGTISKLCCSGHINCGKKLRIQLLRYKTSAAVLPFKTGAAVLKQSAAVLLSQNNVLLSQNNVLPSPINPVLRCCC
jgi:hypothetical protein